MKKYFLFIMLVTSFSYSQIGLEAGYNSLKAEVSSSGTTISASDDQFYFGVKYDFDLNNKLFLQPSVLFSEDMYQFPVSLGYRASNAFSLLAGPVLTSLDFDGADGLKESVIGFNLGIQYNITRKIALSFKYAKDLGDRLEEDYTDIGSLKSGTTRIGASYSF